MADVDVGFAVHMRPAQVCCPSCGRLLYPQPKVVRLAYTACAHCIASALGHTASPLRPSGPAQGAALLDDDVWGAQGILGKLRGSLCCGVKNPV
jgi:hypothetical protein